MLIEFDKDYLRELFEQGRASDKKHRYQPEIIRGYIKCVMFLKRASSVRATFSNPILELRGSPRREKRHFIRLDKPAIPS